MVYMFKSVLKKQSELYLNSETPVLSAIISLPVHTGLSMCSDITYVRLHAGW